MKLKTTLLISTFLFIFHSFSQVQIGSDILGEKPDDYANAQAISQDGKTVAVIAPNAQGADTTQRTGRARVYTFTGGNWTKIGSDIVSDSLYDNYFRTLTMSGDGNVVAIGLRSGNVRVFGNVSGNFIQIGNDINGSFYSQDGYSISLSYDGYTLAIGGPEYDTLGFLNIGRVRVYNLQSGNWVQFGSDIIGKTQHSESGTQVSLSSDGSAIAIGAPYMYHPSAYYSGTDPGHVCVYRFFGNNWTQIGSDIVGEALDDCFGSTLSLSGDGNSIIIGGYGNDAGGTNAGHARVYKFLAGNWTQLGSDFDGRQSYLNWGGVVSINYDGTIVTIGSGYFQTFKFLCNKWIQLGQDIIFGDSTVTNDGYPVGTGGNALLSGDGLTLAIGTSSLFPANTIGVSKVFQLKYSPEIDVKGNNLSILNGDISPNTSDNTDFGYVQGATSKTFTIHNIGTDLLTLIPNSPNIIISGTNAANFTLGTGPGLSVQTCLSKNFTINFNPGTSYGLYTATITILNNDPDESPFVFNVQAMYYPCNQNVLTFIQQGSDINGEMAGDRSGQSVALSSDGQTVAIGSIANDGNGQSSGSVRVFQFNSGSWSQIGADIDGEVALEESGTSVALSADGSILAIGAPYNNGVGQNAGHVRVYKLTSNVWTQMGTDIDAKQAQDYFGQSVGLSADGLTLLVGAPNNGDAGIYAGQLRVFKFVGSNWQQMGTDINGTNAGGQLGVNVSISGDGLTIASGANYAEGLAQVFSWNGNAWIQKGNTLTGDIDGDYFGYDVSLNYNGSVIAIGAPQNNTNGNLTGQVKVFKYSNNNWIQIGSDILGQSDRDLAGEAIDINDNGTILAIGSRNNNDNGAFSGITRLYIFSGGDWIAFGQEIKGEHVGDFSGISVALNSSGNTVAIGAIWNKDNGNESGHVRIYKYDCGQAEIEVRGNNMLVSDGQTLPNASNLTDFGTTSSPVGHTFKIFNTGNINLVISQVLVSGTDSADFTISSFADTIPSGDSGNLVITFTPSNNGLRTAQISIFNNDTNESIYDFSVQGTGTNISVNSTLAASVKLFPNPFNRYLIIALSNNLNDSSQLILTDVSGRVIFEKLISGHQAEINMEMISEGLYFLTIKNNDEQFTLPVIKQ